MQNLPISPSISPVVSPQPASFPTAAGVPDNAASVSTGSDFNTVLARQLALEGGAGVKEAKDIKGVGALSDGNAPVIAETTKANDKQHAAPIVDGVTAAAQSGMLPLIAAPLVPAELKSVATSVPGSETPSGARTSGEQSLLGQQLADKTDKMNGPADKAVLGQSVVSEGNASSASGTQDQNFGAALQAAAGLHPAVPGTPVLSVATSAQQQIAVTPDPAKDAQLLAQSLAQTQNLAGSPQAGMINETQTLTVSTPVGSNRWSEDLGQKITWMASRSEQSAELHLNPPDLGPLNVVLHVSGDQATALFTSPHAEVRDAVQQALPKLREMLADNGIMLGNASVSDQGRQGAQSSFSGGGKSSASSSSHAVEVSSVQQGTRTVSTLQSQGLVDTFA